MSETVYIVLGESGEYSDCWDAWIAGVFLTKAEAQEAMSKRMVVRRTWEEWNGRRIDLLLTTGRREVARQMVGPEPEREEAERVSLYPASIGEWMPAQRDADETVDA